MNLQEYIKFYENELEKQERKKQELLEYDKKTNYVDKKINHIYDLLRILKNCRNTEAIAEENIFLKKDMRYMIEIQLEEIDKAKAENNAEKEKQKVDELIEKLRKITKED